MITLHGSPHSTCTRKVLTVLHEKEAEYRFHPVDLGAGEHKAPAHLQRQPFGVVPTLAHDGLEMYESRAICRYLDRALPGTSLTPTSLHDYARAEQYISVEQSYFSGPALQIFYQKLKNPRMGLPTDPAAIQAARDRLAHTGDVLDARLEGARYFGGESFSLADVMFMPYVALLEVMGDGDLVAKRPSFARWWSEVSARPSWVKTLGLAKT